MTPQPYQPRRKPQRPHRHLTDEERDFLVRTHGTLTAVEQARHLKHDYDAVCFQRQRLIRAGLIAPHTRSYAPVYTDDDRARIVELAQAGYSVMRIGRALGRSYGSIVHEIGRMGGIKQLRSDPTARVWTPAELGELFGLTKKTIDKWVRLGWIASTRNTAPRRGRQRTDRLITDEALQAFLGKREYWPAWHPADITDEDWRDYARDLRSAGDWVTCMEIARQHELVLARIYAWFRLRRDRGIQWMRYGREVFVWSTDVEALIAQIRAYDWTPGAYHRRQTL